jgi:hypothetical protein
MNHMKLLAILASLLMSTTAILAEDSVKHVVSFKFKKEATTEQIKRVETAFAALKGAIPQIQSLDWGTNVSKENLDKGFTHMWILSFKSEADVQTYIDHKVHQDFVSLLKPILDDAFVLDFHTAK